MTAEETTPAAEEILDEVREILEDAYSPEATRASLAKAVGKALDVLNQDEEDEEEDGVDDDDGENAADA